MARRPATGPRGKLRIIGGRWRGSRIAVPEGVALRPSGDRVRETLFNWLAPRLPGAHCLDLFAGTGVLGLEALSRGAAACCFIEREPRLVSELRRNAGRLGAAGAEILEMDALRYLAGERRPYDVVFLDPPFGAADIGKLCTLLAAGWLASDALVYIETSRDEAPALPPGWDWRRRKTAGGVSFGLAAGGG